MPCRGSALSSSPPRAEAERYRDCPPLRHTFSDGDRSCLGSGYREQSTSRPPRDAAALAPVTTAVQRPTVVDGHQAIAKTAANMTGKEVATSATGLDPNSMCGLELLGPRRTPVTMRTQRSSTPARRISFARHSSRFSCSRRFTLSCSAVVTPVSKPVRISHEH